MFTQAQTFVSTPPPTGPSHIHDASVVSSTALNNSANTSAPRSSRLRGLSYLRNYTQNHLLSRDHHSQQSQNQSASGGGSSSSASSSGSESGNLTTIASRSETVTPRPARSTGGSTTNRNNRLTLINGKINSAPQIPPPLPTSESSGLLGADIVESPQQENQQSSGSAALPVPSDDMTRARASTAGEATTAATGSISAASAANVASEMLPSIRFVAYFDPRSTRPSLTFPPLTRTLPTGSEMIRVGRYSERDSQSMANMPNNAPSAAPIGFKSKVVSRRHCEFWYENGKWWVKDVKSSSGTFLNHIRLSPPSQESKAFPVNDGDIIQLGIDFKGGEEPIFRCVKMRLELNRGWQNKLNTFNMAAHKRLRTMGAASNDASSKSASQDCSICLNSIAPCQSLFVAPCSHTWHFKCVKSLLQSPQYPIFICPNCRAGADLEADVEEPAETWEQDGLDDDGSPSAVGGNLAQAETTMALPNLDANTADAGETTIAVTPEGRVGQLPHAVSEPLAIRNTSGTNNGNRTPSPPGHGPDGPITPRNEAGPWVFDGSGGRTGTTANGGMRSIDAAAEAEPPAPNATANGNGSDSSDIL